ncbi:hypothetical protein ABIB57_000986 [Devosia sp. UYZn731]
MYQATPSRSLWTDNWLQAGFSSIAYRLAHLSFHRLFAVTLASMVFYFC